MIRIRSLGKKLKLILIVSFLAACTCLILGMQSRTVYQVEYGGEELGVVSDLRLLDEWGKEQTAIVQAEFKDVELKTNQEDFTINPVIRIFTKTQDEKVKTNFYQRFVVEGLGYTIEVNGQVIGTVQSKNTADSILQKIKNNYLVQNQYEVTTLSLKNEQKQDNPMTIKSVQFIEEVKVSTVNEDPTLFSKPEEILKKLKGEDIKRVTYTVKEGDCVSCIAKDHNISQEVIYSNNPWIQDDFISIGDKLDLTVRKPKLSVKTTEEYSEELLVPRGVKVVYDNSMRVGSSKVINQGKPGKKTITYLQTKINGELVDEKVIKTEIQQKAVQKMVLQGSKVVDGVGTGIFDWPIKDPTITSQFGKRWGRFHAGTDSVSSDRTISAADNGKVIYAGYKSDYGNHVIIDHQNGYKTLYAHMSKISLKKGQLVEKDDKVGIMGTTGRSTGVHLHFEIRSKNEKINPLTFLNE
ncbi:M23 family metallopeptidase [Paenibacillus sp. MMO-58]|uniref:M23 family metallopeptidase n=1 Tax=Paenibacillus sp. MMO-58 TaxID=3081290 RepID=UPI0030193C87